MALAGTTRRDDATATAPTACATGLTHTFVEPTSRAPARELVAGCCSSARGLSEDAPGIGPAPRACGVRRRAHHRVSRGRGASGCHPRRGVFSTSPRWRHFLPSRPSPRRGQGVGCRDGGSATTSSHDPGLDEAAALLPGALPRLVAALEQVGSISPAANSIHHLNYAMKLSLALLLAPVAAFQAPSQSARAPTELAATKNQVRNAPRSRHQRDVLNCTR